MKKYLKLFRVKHYLKNVLIFIPAFFGEELFQKYTLKNIVISFVAFSLISSFVYIFNDIKDCEQDKLHEVKKNRPIASGEIGKRRAGIMGIISLVVAFFLICYINKFPAFLIASLYIILNILYSVGLKNIPIIDVLILASGFVIRVLYGAIVAGVECSSWLILTIMAASLYLGLGKRRNELVKVKDSETRMVLKKYSFQYLDMMMRMCMTIGVVFYSLWSVDIGKKSLNNFYIWTIPIVISIIMKYELDIEKNSYGDPIEVLYKDKVLLCMGFLYVLIIFIGKYIL